MRILRAPVETPLRVDFAGGWLDVPRFARPGGSIVNCAISPLVSLADWPYRARSGLGGSAAYAVLQGDDGVRSEMNLGVGWQDPAVILETGLCVWKSGLEPRLEFKGDGEMLRGRMALLWTGQPHDTPGVVALARDFARIERAGALARRAVCCGSLELRPRRTAMNSFAAGMVFPSSRSCDLLGSDDEAFNPRKKVREGPPLSRVWLRVTCPGPVRVPFAAWPT